MQKLEAAALEHKPPLGVNAHLLDHRLRAQLDTRRPCRLLQALNHGLRTVLLRKHPSIGFLHQREPMLVKPGDRIAAGEATEGAPQRSTATGVMGRQFTGVPAGMGHIAATATADAHLLEGFWGAFQHQHPPNPLLSCSDRRHVPGRTTANNDQIKRAGSGGRHRCCSSACRWVAVRH